MPIIVSILRTALVALTMMPFVARPGAGAERAMIEAAIRDERGNTYIAGTFAGASTRVGGAVLTKSPASGADLFVAMLDAGGVATWAANFGSAHSPVKAIARAIAVDGSGAVFVAGAYAGGGLDDLRLPATAAETGFVMRFDPRVGLGWSVPVADCRVDIGDLALDAEAGAVFLSGAVDTLKSLPRRPHKPDADAMVARLDAATGTIRWLRRIPGAGGNPRGQAIVLDGETRRLYLAGDAASAALPDIVRPDRDGRFVLKMLYDNGDAEPLEEGGADEPG